MRVQNETIALGCTRAVVGLSASVLVASLPYQACVEIGLISGGTLEMSGTTGAWGAGRPFTTQANNDHIKVNGPAPFYLCASGATCVAHITYCFTQVP